MQNCTQIIIQEYFIFKKFDKIKKTRSTTHRKEVPTTNDKMSKKKRIAKKHACKNKKSKTLKKESAETAVQCTSKKKPRRRQSSTEDKLENCAPIKSRKKPCTRASSALSKIIQDQLQIQREKQKVDVKVKRKRHEKIGNYEYDPVRKTYFPISWLRKNKKKIENKIIAASLNEHLLPWRQHKEFKNSAVHNFISMSLCSETSRRKFIGQRILEKIIVKEAHIKCSNIEVRTISNDEDQDDNQNRSNERCWWTSILSPIMMPNNMIDKR